MDFADELMGYENLKANRHVVDCLRRAIEAMVRLGGEVVDSQDQEPAKAEKPTAPHEENSTVEVQFEKDQSHQVQPAVDIWPETSDLSLIAPGLLLSEPLFTPIEPLSQQQLAPIPTFHSFESSQPSKPPPLFFRNVFGNGWLPSHGDFVDMTPPFDGIYVPTDSFSYRLVERTLASTYSILVRDQQIANENTKSIFRYTLQTKTREGILTHVRWMLGPGRHRVFKAVDIPASRVAEILWRGQSHLVEWDGEAIFRTESYEEGLAKGPLPPAMLSAMEVQQKLEQLGARDVGNDTLELRLPGSADNSSSPDSDAEAYRSQYMTEATTIRLSMPLLIDNLSSTAVCLQVGPGFRSDELYGAVEASVIPTPFEGVP